MTIHNSDSLDSLHSMAESKPLCEGVDGTSASSRGLCEDGRLLAVSGPNHPGSSPSNTTPKPPSDLPKDNTSRSFMRKSFVGIFNSWAGLLR